MTWTKQKQFSSTFNNKNGIRPERLLERRKYLCSLGENIVYPNFKENSRVYYILAPFMYYLKSRVVNFSPERSRPLYKYI